MPTEKQLAANRLNAQKSTGPKTPQGKARVAANAVTHGLTAACPVLASEDPGAYARFRTDMAARLAPAGDIETLLADRVINLAWRLQRAQNYESYVLDNLIRSAADNPAPDVPASSDASASAILAQILLDDFTGPQVLEKLQRYESRIERSFFKALKELQTTQSLNPMISPGKDNFSLSPHRGTDVVVDHPIKSNPHDSRRGYVDKPNPVPPRGIDVVVDHTSLQSSIKNHHSPNSVNPVNPVHPVKKETPGPARPSLAMEHSASVAGASSFGINQHPSQTDSALNPAHHVNPVKSSKPEVTKTITLPDHLALQSSIDNPQSPIFSSAVLNKLLQNKPNSPEFNVSSRTGGTAKRSLTVEQFV